MSGEHRPPGEKRHKSGEQIALEAAERAERITDLHETIAIQVATLSELSHELVERGMDEDARLARRVIVELGVHADVVNRVASALPHLEALTLRMRELQKSARSIKWDTKPIVVALEGMKKALVARCDVTLIDTQVDMKLPDDLKDGPDESQG